MKAGFLIIALIVFLASSADAQFTFAEDPSSGTLTIRNGKADVLVYRYGDQLKAGVNPIYTQSCYIHPLFSLDGKVLTDDSPADHLHHHGVFWTWPNVKVRGVSTGTWEPKLPRLRQFFVRWLKREPEKDAFLLSVENAWKLEGKEIVAREIVTLRVHPADKLGRSIDVELIIEAIGGPLELQGTLDQNKGYGGLSFRGAPMFTGATLTTDEGPRKEDVVYTAFRWTDISTSEAGVSIFISPGHPGFPARWLIRNSFAGLIFVSWPGLTPVVLNPGEPITLRYRLYVHRGDASAGEVAAAYRRFLGGAFL